MTFEECMSLDKIREKEILELKEMISLYHLPSFLDFINKLSLVKEPLKFNKEYLILKNEIETSVRKMVIPQMIIDLKEKFTQADLYGVCDVEIAINILKKAIDYLNMITDHKLPLEFSLEISKIQFVNLDADSKIVEGIKKLTDKQENQEKPVTNFIPAFNYVDIVNKGRIRGK
jgi:hypothetical protein